MLIARHLPMIMRAPEAPTTAAPAAPSPEPSATAPDPLGMPTPQSDDVFEGDDGGDDVDLSNLFDQKPSAPAVAPQEPALASAGGAAPQAASAIPSPAPGATPPATPQAQPAAATPQPQAAAPAAAQPAAAPAATPTADTVEQIQQRYNERRTEQVQRLAAETFRLTDEQAQMLETNPREAVPHLMAQACMAAIEATTVAVANMLPSVVANMSEGRRAQDEGENAFVTKWPALKDHIKDPRAIQVARLYRQMNPQASAEEFIQAVGPIVHMTLNVPMQAAAAAPAAPAAPRTRPHTPPMGGAPARAPVTNGHDNIFTQMAEDDFGDQA